MATNLDAILNGITLTVDGANLTPTINSDTLRAIFLIAVAALDVAHGRTTSAGRVIGFDMGTGTGRHRVEVTIPAS